MNGVMKPNGFKTARVPYDVKSRERKMSRQLHEAIKRNDLIEVNRSLNSDIDLEFPYCGGTALQIAVEQNHPDICRRLIKRGSDVNRCDSKGDSLLSIATIHGYKDIVRILLDAGADTDQTNFDSMTALHYASGSGGVDIVQALVDRNCMVDRSNTKGESPLTRASEQGFADIVKILIAHGSDLEWTDHEKRTPLIVATQKGHKDVAQLLVSSGCNVDASDQYGCTALYFTAKYGYTGIVKLLVTAGADLNKSDTRGATPLTGAIESMNLDIVRTLIDAGSNVNIVNNDSQETALNSAIKCASDVYGQRSQQMELIKLLLFAKCDVNLPDRHGWSPLYFAARGGETDLVQELIDLKADVGQQTNTKDTMLHGSIYGNRPEITKLLIEAGCCVNSANEKNELPIYTAIEHRGNNQIIKMLLEAGSKTDVCSKKMHQSPLFVAVQQNYVEAVHLLINAGCDVNLPNYAGSTPLWVACSTGNDEIVQILLQHPKIQVDQGSNAPIHAAAMSGSRSVMEKLINAGCDVNKLSDMSKSALFLAAEHNHLPVARLLVRHGANPSAAHRIKPPALCCFQYNDEHPHLELEPLMGAIENDNLLMVKLILTASPRMPYAVLRTLQDIVFRTDYAREARLSQKAIVQYAQFFVKIQSQPRSLKEECRGTIRECLGNYPEMKVQYLPVPERFKGYLLLEGCKILDESLN